MILGCDAAGIDDDGNEVIVHAVVSSDDWRGDETLDPKRSLLSEIHQGTLAEYVVVPRRNLVPKPADLTFARGRVPPDRVADRVPHAVHQLRRTARQHDPRARRRRRRVDRAHLARRAAGYRVWVTSRSEEKRARARGDRRARRVRDRRATSRARRRGHGDGRRRDVEPLTEGAATGRHARRLRVRPPAPSPSRISAASSSCSCASSAPRWAPATSSPGSRSSARPPA